MSTIPPKHQETIEKRQRLVERFRELKSKGMSQGRAMDTLSAEFDLTFQTVYQYLARDHELSC